MNQPRHTPADAVQYWYDAATERREERDRLRAVVARVRQMADAWEQQLPEVIRTPAVVSALRAALEPAAAAASQPKSRTTIVEGPQTVSHNANESAASAVVALPTDRAARDRIVEALLTTHHREHGYHADCVVCAGDVSGLATAVLAVLPEPADRAAEDRVRALHRKATHGDDCVHCAAFGPGYDNTWPCQTIRALDGTLPEDDQRRLAVEAHDTGTQQPGAPTVARQTLVDLVRDFLDPDPCSFDHHGYCQAHSWLCGGSPCPHGRAREVLAAIDADEPGPVAQQPAAEEEGELVCVDQCGSCDACGMEPFGTPAEGWREAARFLRRTPRDSVDFPGALRGARLIEDELRRQAEEAQQAAAADGEETPTVEAYLDSRCDTCRHTLRRHDNSHGCTVVLCVCSHFEEPGTP